MNNLFFKFIIISLMLFNFSNIFAESIKAIGPLVGKTAMISGGTGGIGKIISLELAKAGANVIFVTHNPDGAKELIKEIEKYGVKGDYVSGAGNDEKQVIEMITQIIKKYGSLDIAINNSGFGLDNPSYPLKSVSDSLEKDWDQIINGTLKGYFISMKQEILQMKKQGKGVIINTALDGLYLVKENGALYYANKAGVQAITKAAALENKNNGIRVNMVYTDTTLKNQESVGKIISWLCADSASDITGESISAANN